MISVCLAAYNGEQWINEQISSILAQLGDADELIVVDDASTDATCEVIGGIEDDRIKVHVNDRNLGHVGAFERALSLASGDVVFLADQDDVWVPGRVDAMCRALATSQVVATRFAILGHGSTPATPDWARQPHDRAFFARNILGIFVGTRPYFGSAMALRQSFLRALLPFPQGTEAHDLWIALAANAARQMRHSDTVTLLRRVHGTNLTPDRRRPLHKVAMTRLRMLWMLLVAEVRVWRRSRSTSGEAHGR